MLSAAVSRFRFNPIRSVPQRSAAASPYYVLHVADEQYAPALAAASTFASCTHERRQIDFVLPVPVPELHGKKYLYQGKKC